MRPYHCRLTSAIVTQALCERMVRHLSLRDYKLSVPAQLLARLLLLAAAVNRSLSYVAQRCRKAPSDETCRQALLDNLPGEALLQSRLVEALHELLPRRLRRCPQRAALDYHLEPWYGDKNTPGIRGGQREAGTRYFWTYATLCLLSRGQRYTVGFCHVAQGETCEQVVYRLLAQVSLCGVRLRNLLMDKAFHDAAVIDLLQQRGIPFVVPMTCRGKEDSPNSTAKFFRRCQVSGFSSHTWTARARRWDEEKQKHVRSTGVTVTVAVCVVARGRDFPPLVFATWGISWSAYLVHQRYRSRFGIETSYRQLGQTLGATTTGDLRRRILHVGVAWLIRQVWCRGIDDTLEEPPRRSQRLRLADLEIWLILELCDELGFIREWGTEPPDKPELTAA